MLNDFIKHKYIYELNTRIFCLDNHCTLEQLPDWFFELPEVIAADYIWFMGIWKPSPKSLEICKSHQGLNSEFKKALPDLHENDILGSPYSIFEYTPNPLVSKGLERLRRVKEKLNKMGKKMILDFVPNHMSVDTIYLEKYPDLFLKKSSGNHTCHNSFYYEKNDTTYYHGRDPYFDGWTDTVQWDFSNPEVLNLHIDILSHISYVCDGLRCDMAMLPQNDVFFRTHGKQAVDYWKPLISSIKSENPDFIFIGEVYWNKEYELQMAGFDFTYDKVLYDRLKERNAHEIRSHLNADIEYQNHSLRFIENHDEERAFHTFQEDTISIFALLSFLPGLTLYYEGQSIGSEVKVPVQLGRTQLEPNRPNILDFYKRAFKQIASRKDNELHTYNPVFHSYEAIGYNPLLVKIFYFKKDKEYLELFMFNPEDRMITGWFILNDDAKSMISRISHDKIEMQDLISNELYIKDKNELLTKGIYIQLNTYKAHWFVLEI